MFHESFGKRAFWMRIISANAVDTTVPPLRGSVKNVCSSTSSATSVWRMNTISTRLYRRSRKTCSSRKKRFARSFICSDIEPDTSIRQNITARADGFGVIV